VRAALLDLCAALCGYALAVACALCCVLAWLGLAALCALGRALTGGAW
jgi:hypothetical protein